jgi:Spy/CpxP family protein refolding chaperone
MKTYLFILMIALAAARPALAQKRPNQGKADGGQIEAIKVGLITKRLELSAEQSKQFWPVYNAYTKDIQQVRRELRQLKRRGLTLTDDELKKEMDKMFDLMEKEVDTQRKYHREFLKVASPRQVAELYKAEAEFKALLLKRLGARAGEDEGE